jgi:ribosomal protein S18 acetylase RimI-like enzyme
MILFRRLTINDKLWDKLCEIKNHPMANYLADIKGKESAVAVVQSGNQVQSHLLNLGETESRMDEMIVNPVIIPMHLDHVNAVVSVHLASFHGYFLSFLGPRFLHLLYTEIIKEPDHIAFVAQDASGVVGFVVGVTQQSGFYARLARKRQYAFAIAALGAAARNVKIIPRLFRALSYSRRSRTAAAQALLMSIGVLPEVQHTGVGKRLITTFLNAMRQEKVDKVSLTTDRDGNEKVNNFYQKLGFNLYRTYVTPEGRGINEYVIDLSACSQLPDVMETMGD